MKPMTVKQILGDDLVSGEEGVGGDAALREILGELVGEDTKGSGKAGNKGSSGGSDTPAWQKYVNLTAQFLPPLTEGIAEAAKKPDKNNPKDKEFEKENKEHHDGAHSGGKSSLSFLSQEVGPLPLWGWGAVLAAVGGGVLIYFKKFRKS